MADLPLCPLNPFVMDQLGNRMNLARVMDIEEHKSTGACVHPPLKDIVLHGSLDGSTPLLLACEEGHLDSVKRIIEDWKTDVDAVGIYYLHGMKSLRATPLIIASLKGHSDIVDYLITKGADVFVSASTEGCYLRDLLNDGLNPLHAALIDDRLGQSFSEKCTESSEIVRRLLAAGANPNTLDAQGNPVWAMRFCGVDATIALVKHALNLNQRNSEGKTILHHWIEFDDYNTYYTEQERLVIIQLLADRGADLKAQDANGFTPILLAAESTRLGILDELLKRSDIDRNDKIVAMELAGSHLFCLIMPVKLDIDKAFDYWRRALLLGEGADPAVNKIPLLMRRGQAVEWVSLEDLEQQNWKGWIQGLLTRLKIYAEKSLKTVDKYLESGYFYYLDLDRYDLEYENYIETFWATRYDVVTVMLTVLETILRFHLEEGELPVFSSKSRVLEELFSSLEQDDPFFNEENFTSSMQLISAVDPDCSLTTPPYEFFVILADLPTALLHGDVRKYLSHAVRRAGTLLPSAYYREDWKTLRLLLHLGGDVNAMDYYRAQPLLHTAAVREEDPRVLEGTHEREQISNEIEYTPAHLLYDYGANPYRINHEGKTAVDAWVEKNCGGKGMQSEAWNHRPHWCRDTVPKLTCLAAKTMHTHAISYSYSDDLPENHPHLISKELYQFLENH